MVLLRCTFEWSVPGAQEQAVRAASLLTRRRGPGHVQAVAVVDVGHGEDDVEVRDEPERIAQENR